MSKLKDSFPDILKNEFKLSRLTLASARLAIEEPAKKEGQFYSREFEFEQSATDRLLGQIDPEKTSRIDPIQIQIACIDIEKRIISGKIQDKVNEEDVKDFKDLMNHFYKEKWEEVRQQYFHTEEKEFNYSRNKICSALLSGENRIPVHVNDLESIPLGVEVANSLCSKGILQQINLDGQTFYRINHDRIAVPFFEEVMRWKESKKEVKENRKKLEEATEQARKERLYRLQLLKEKLEEELQRQNVESEKTILEKRQKYLSVIGTGFAIFSLIISILSFFILDQKNNANAQRFVAAARPLESTNPTLAFYIAAMGMELGNNTNELSSLVDRFVSYDHTYNTKDIPILSGLKEIELNHENQLQIMEEDRIAIWDYEDNIAISFDSYSDRELLKTFNTSRGRIYGFLTASEDIEQNLELRDTLDCVINSINVSDHRIRDARDVEISSNRRLALIEDVLYDLESSKPLDTLPDYGLQDQMVANFINGSGYLAVGYWRGLVLIYKIDPNETEVFKLVRLLDYPNGNRYNGSITAIDVDEKKQLLAAGNRINSVEIWSIANLDEGANLTIKQVMRQAEDREPIYRLKGHEGEINRVAFSEDGKQLLSGSDDGNAILWNLENGSRESTLRSGENIPITKVGFVDDSNTMYTSGKGHVWFWKNKNPKELLELNEFKKYSPFYFYSRGIDDITYDEIYNDKSINYRAKNIYDYMRSIPKFNRFPESKEYISAWASAFSEVNAEYQEFLENLKISEPVDSYLLESIEDEFIQLRIAKLEFPTINDDVNSGNKDVLKSKIYSERVQELLKDTSDLKNAISYSIELIELNNEIIEEDPLSPVVSENFDTIEMVHSAYLHKYSESDKPKELSQELISFYESKEQYHKAYTFAMECRLNCNGDSYYERKTSRLALFVGKQQQVLLEFEGQDFDEVDSTIRAYIITAHLINGDLSIAERMYIKLYQDLSEYNVQEFFEELLRDLLDYGVLDNDAFNQFNRAMLEVVDE
ncbi:MAG: hypothetical protein KTR22_07315 [Flavobacteriaceae bacterium]|nr:hypothetical protein [Flavobacteriaceae bacterium]